MTARQVWEGMLTELSKVNAPSMLLQDFNYFFNKAINQYINKRYNIYDVNQQTTDDLRVLKATAMLDPVLTTEYDGSKDTADSYKYVAGASKLFGATYEVILPSDYLHMLNCVCIYKLNKNHKCYDRGNYVQFAAKRLTADSWSVIVNDYYNRPLPERPYYYIHNVNNSVTIPTNPIRDESLEKGFATANKNAVAPTGVGTDIQDKYKVSSGADETIVGGTPERVSENDSTTGYTNFDRVISLTGDSSAKKKVSSSVERETAQRYGNASKVRCEIRYGKDNSVFALEKVFIDYIKAPQTIRLTQEQVDLTEDTSQIMEFPDYVCQEIINELVTLVMENTADPRLRTHPIVTQSIANPVQQQTAQPQSQERD